jgi:ElaB/YqjD/DUF883 family membrane-anchored ribosome-binding protein
MNQSIEKTPEDIQVEMNQTRDSITRKVAALEHQVLGTAKAAANTVSDSIGAVRSIVSSVPRTIEEAAGTARQAIGDALNLSGRIDRNPWTSVGISVGIGMIAGWSVLRRTEGPASRTQDPVPATMSTQRTEPGFFEDLLGSIEQRIRAIAESALSSATEAINRNVREQMPELVDTCFRNLDARLEGITSATSRDTTESHEQDPYPHFNARREGAGRTSQSRALPNR